MGSDRKREGSRSILVYIYECGMDRRSVSTQDSTRGRDSRHASPHVSPVLSNHGHSSRATQHAPFLVVPPPIAKQGVPWSAPKSFPCRLVMSAFVGPFISRSLVKSPCSSHSLGRSFPDQAIKPWIYFPQSFHIPARSLCQTIKLLNRHIVNLPKGD